MKIRAARFALLPFLLVAHLHAADPPKPATIGRGEWRAYLTDEYRGCKFFAPGATDDPKPQVMDWMSCSVFAIYGPQIAGAGSLDQLALIQVAKKDLTLAMKLLAEHAPVSLGRAAKPMFGSLIIADRPKSRELLAAHGVPYRALVAGGRLVDPKTVTSDEGNTLLVTPANLKGRSALVEMQAAVIPFVILNEKTAGGLILATGQRDPLENMLRLGGVIPLE